VFGYPDETLTVVGRYYSSQNNLVKVRPNIFHFDDKAVPNEWTGNNSGIIEALNDASFSKRKVACSSPSTADVMLAQGRFTLQKLINPFGWFLLYSLPLRQLLQFLPVHRKIQLNRRIPLPHHVLGILARPGPPTRNTG